MKSDINHTSEDQLNAHLEINFRIIGLSETCHIATAWLENSFVRWSSPCLDQSHERVDTEVFADLFGDFPGALPAFTRSMQWFEAVCCGAADLEEVRRACLLNPEYGIVCMLVNMPKTGKAQ